MKPKVCASLDLSTCQIAVWCDLSISRFSAISDCTRILEEVRDCRSGVETLCEVSHIFLVVLYPVILEIDHGFNKF